jgi:CelD/BcsL family acetyltransferase involved in cellulose biosynthesis
VRELAGGAAGSWAGELGGEAVVELPSGDPAWADLIGTAPGATVFHLPAWSRVIADTYGYRAAVLAELDAAGRVVAGVPAMRVRRPGGRAWVSLPFSDHCPPLARDDASLRRLAARLVGWSERERAPLEVRGTLPALPGWNPAVIGVRHVLPLDGDLDGLRRRFSRGHRERLKQAERGPLRVRLGRSADDLRAFYRLQVETRRRQGVPVQPHRFFAAVWAHVVAPGLGVVALVETPAGRAVAGAVMFGWNGTAIGKFQASDAAHWRERPNHLLYWAAIRWAAEAGNREFDFGRSDAGHTGLQDFKSGWGGRAVALSYAVTGGAGPEPSGHGRVQSLLAPVIRHSPAFVCRAAGALLYRFAG